LNAVRVAAGSGLTLPPRSESCFGFFDDLADISKLDAVASHQKSRDFVVEQLIEGRFAVVDIGLIRHLTSVRRRIARPRYKSASSSGHFQGKRLRFPNVDGLPGTTASWQLKKPAEAGLSLRSG
jgi:hypothetical protein